MDQYYDTGFRGERQKTVYDGKRLREAIVRKVVTPIGPLVKHTEVKKFIFHFFFFF